MTYYRDDVYILRQCCDARRGQRQRATHGPGSRLAQSMKRDPTSEVASTTDDSEQAFPAAAAGGGDVFVGRGSSEEASLSVYRRPLSICRRRRSVGRQYHDDRNQPST